jgi:quinol-cytochrome oxidoreductase complex cytochrome b subunit
MMRTKAPTSPATPSRSGSTTGCRSSGGSQRHLMDFPTPKNLNYWWTFGAILAFMLVVQIVTGIVLAMHYTPHVSSPSTRWSTSAAT